MLSIQPCFTGNFQKLQMSAFGFVFSVSIDLFITKVKTSSHSGKKFPQPSNLGLSESLLPFPTGNLWGNGVICKWRHLQLNAFLSFCPSLSSETEHNATALGKNPHLSFHPGGVRQEILQSITAWFPDSPWAGVGTVSVCWDHGWGQRWAGEGRKRTPGSSAQETTWPVHVGLLIFGVVQGESQVFFLYLSVSWLKFLKMTEQVDKSVILFSISLHSYFIEKAGVRSNPWTFG